MNDFMNEMIDNNLDLQDSLIESRKKQVEGIVANTDTESEETAIKKLTEEEEGLEQDKPETATEEDFQDDIEEEPAEDPDEDEGVDKEYFGKTGDNSYYLVGQQSDEGSTEDLQVVDQEGEKVFSAKDNELEITDVTDFIIQAVQDMDMEDMSADVFTKYVLPRLVEPEEEEETSEEEVDDTEDFEDESSEDEDTMIPEEEDTFESWKKIGKKVNEAVDPASVIYVAHVPMGRAGRGVWSYTIPLSKLATGFDTLNDLEEDGYEDFSTFFNDENQYSKVVKSLKRGKPVWCVDVFGEGAVGFGFTKKDAKDQARIGVSGIGDEMYESKVTSYTFKDKVYEIRLLPKNNVSLGGKLYPLSESTLKFYNITSTKVDESDLKDLAKDMLRAMDEKELNELKESHTVRGKRDGTGPYKGSARRSVSNIGRRKAAGEKCPVKKTNEDITADVKDLQKQAEQAVKDGDYLKAADLVSRLANVETSVGKTEEAAEGEDVESVVEPIVDDGPAVEVTVNDAESEVENATEEELEDEIPEDVKEQVSFLSTLLDEGMYR